MPTWQTGAPPSYGDALDVVQTGLDVVGMIPVAGEALDLANAGISAARGDTAGAALSLAAMVPLAGTGATVAKFAAKYGDEVAAVVKGADEAAGTFRIGRNALFWTDDGGWKTVRFVSRRPSSVKTTSLRASVNVC